MTPRLGIIIPCYNEEEVLPETGRRIVGILDDLAASGKVGPDSAVYFVDDGSTDDTWSTVETLASEYRQIHGIKLSRNQGHQTALLAGLFGAEGDALVTIDADLQDDVTVIEDMIDSHLDGADIVLGVREARPYDTAFKRSSANLYYKALNLLGVDVTPNHADFRLMSRRAIECLNGFREVNLFLRGIIPLIGFRTDTVFYTRQERLAGESKYPLRKMLAFSLDGVTSFSIMPLRLIAVLGLVLCVFSAFMVIWVLMGKLFFDTALPGWASSVIPIYFLGGVQLLSIGVLGEYVAKIYLETKRRPRYFIEKTL